MEEIEGRGVKPRSSFSVWAEWGVLWLVWGLVLVFGALAVAGTIFALSETEWEFRRIGGDGFLDILVDALPLLWIGFLALAVVLLDVIYRKTDKGYRAGVLWVVGLSVVGTGLVGGLLYTIGAGELVERELGARIPVYRTVDERNVKGLVGGPLSEYTRVGVVSASSEGQFVLTDLHGDDLEIVFESKQLEETCLQSNGLVHVIGIEQDGVFVVCEVISRGVPNREFVKATVNPQGEMPGNHSGERLEDVLGLQEAPQDCESLKAVLSSRR